MLSALVKTGQPHLVVFTGSCAEQDYLLFVFAVLLVLRLKSASVHSGDIIDGRICGDFPKDAWKELFQEITKPLVELKIPWAYIPGNHDDDGASWGTNELLQVFSLPGCVTPNAKSFNHTYTVGYSRSF
jgi:3',5'-cyclic AMP phosphodiesterase CpdA